MGKGIFITGTDTGVGKTYVAAGLIRALKEKGLSVCPFKPVETGCKVRRGSLIPADTVRLVKASGIDEKVDLINPYKMRSPVAPSVASETEKVAIDKRRIVSSYVRLRGKYDFMVAEGAGGIMVPVRGGYLVRDLIRDLNVPLVIVARPGLGTINHTLLTVASAVDRELDVLGVVINYAVKSRRGQSEKTNPQVIEKLGGAPLLGTVPYSQDASRDGMKDIFAQIADRIMSRL